MLRYYEMDLVLLNDDRVGAIFSRIIDKISNSRRLTKLVFQGLVSKTGKKPETGLD